MSDMLARAARRILTMVGAARISMSNDTGSVQTVQASVDPAETIDEVTRLAEFGLATRPPQGSDVLVIFMGGDRTMGVAVATGHQPSRPTGLEEGESMLYSQIGQQVFLSRVGIVVEAKGLPVTVNNASDVTVNCSGKVKFVAPGGMEFETPMLKVSGDVQDQAGSGNSQTMRSMRGTYNEHGHPVSGVDSGSSTVTSQQPNQSM